MLQRSFLMLCVFLGLLLLGGFAWRSFSSRRQQEERTVLEINKEPVAFLSHRFDPASPPADMPPLSPGESAEADSEFRSSASVRGETQPTDATHATVTITQVKVTLQLKINVWLPSGASQHLIEHEDGHRQISEYYYQTADELARHIASTVLDRRVEITGADLGAASNSMLQQLANEITAEYGKELNPNPAQLLYDSITEHGRNDVRSREAVDHAIKNVAIEAPNSK